MSVVNVWSVPYVSMIVRTVFYESSSEQIVDGHSLDATEWCMSGYDRR